jgi:hypothetical protein
MAVPSNLTATSAFIYFSNADDLIGTYRFEAYAGSSLVGFTESAGVWDRKLDVSPQGTIWASTDPSIANTTGSPVVVDNLVIKYGTGASAGMIARILHPDVTVSATQSIRYTEIIITTYMTDRSSFEV